jgi:aryl-alcohol dehydrogenase-like predicted oxidoreductase
VSTWAAWQIAKALGIAERKRWARFAVLQPMYNLVKRQAEVELLPLAAEEGLGVIPYSPLGGGLLTGKYGITARPESGRLMENQMYQKRYGDETLYAVAERFNHYARERGVHPATLAVRWVMHHPAVTAPIIGARNVQQLEASLAAADEPLSMEERAAISALSPAPAVATDRSEERA